MPEWKPKILVRSTLSLLVYMVLYSCIVRVPHSFQVWGTLLTANYFKIRTLIASGFSLGGDWIWLLTH